MWVFLEPWGFLMDFHRRSWGRSRPTSTERWGMKWWCWCWWSIFPFLVLTEHMMSEPLRTGRILGHSLERKADIYSQSQVKLLSFPFKIFKMGIKNDWNIISKPLQGWAQNICPPPSPDEDDKDPCQWNQEATIDYWVISLNEPLERAFLVGVIWPHTSWLVEDYYDWVLEHERENRRFSERVSPL